MIILICLEIMVSEEPLTLDPQYKPWEWNNETETASPETVVNEELREWEV